MLTSAPFDNWWHNAYGLDVRIISPPHALLAIGIFSIVVGALLLTLAEQNRADERQRGDGLAWLLAATGGMFIMNFALFLTEFSERHAMHSAIFYCGRRARLSVRAHDDGARDQAALGGDVGGGVLTRRSCSR